MFFPTRRPRLSAPPLPAGRRKPSHPAARPEGDLMEGAYDHSDRRPGPSPADMRIGQRRAALVALLDLLAAAGYDFVSPTPATHRRVASRRERARAANLRDIFGWGRPFDPNDLDPIPAAIRVDGHRRGEHRRDSHDARFWNASSPINFSLGHKRREP